MSVPNQDPESQHVGNGVTTVFAYGFLLLTVADLSVYVDGVPKVLNVDYSVSGLLAPSGGSVTFAAPPANGAEILLQRDVELERTTDYQYAGDFQSKTVNNDYDRIWMALQDAFRNFRTSIRFPRGEGFLNAVLPRAALRARKAVVFDDDGNVAVSNDDYIDQAENAAASAAAALLARNQTYVARDQVVDIAATFSDEANARLDEIQAEGDEILEGFTTEGNFRLAEFSNDAAAVLANHGYLVPVTYTAGLQMTVPNQTVEYLGQTYAPIKSELPFTTSGVFEVTKFRLIQGVSGADLAASYGAGMMGYRHTQGSATTTAAKKMDAILAPVDQGGSDLPVVEVRQRLNSAQNRNIIWVPHANDIHPDLNACTIFGGGDTLQRHLIGYSLNPQMFNGAGGVFVWPYLPATTLSRLRLFKINAGGTQTILALTTDWTGAIGASDVTISLVAPLIAGERLYVEDLDAKVPHSGATPNYSAIGSGYDCVIVNGPMQVAMGAHHRIFGGDGGHSAIIGGSYSQIWTGAYHVIVGGTQSEISGAADLGSAVLGGIRGRVTGSSSVTVGGNGLQVSGSYAAALGGYQNVVSGLGSSATGYQNAASGSYSWVTGRENKAAGQYSVVAGYKNQANHQYTDIRNGYAGVTMYHGQQVDWMSRQFSEGIGPNTGAWKMPLTAFSQTSPISLAVFASGATTIPITAGQVWKAKLTVIQGPAARAKFWVVDFICTSTGFLEAPVVTIQDPNSRAGDNITVAIVAGSLTVEATFAAAGTSTFQYFGWLEVVSIG